MTTSGAFKRQHSTSERIRRASKCPSDHVPIIIERSLSAQSTTIPAAKKSEFFIPKKATLGEFLWKFRRDKLGMNKKGILNPINRGGGGGAMEGMAVFVFINEELKVMGQSMASVYEEGCELDGWCYVVYAVENTFG